MTPYERWLKVVATPGKHKFPWKWAQAIMAVAYIEGEDWRHEKRVINRICRKTPSR